MVHPQEEPEEEPDGMNWHGEEEKVVNFDKLTPQRRAAMRIDWTAPSKEGDPV